MLKYLSNKCVKTKGHKVLIKKKKVFPPVFLQAALSPNLIAQIPQGSVPS